MKYLALLFLTFAFPLNAAGSTTISFEDLPEIIYSPEYLSEHPHDGENGVMPEGYAGFGWENVGWYDSRFDFDNGFAYGAVSGVYASYNPYGRPCSLHADPFYFEGAYFTAAWNQGLNLNLQGYMGGVMLWEETVILDSARPTWFDFGDTGLIDRLYFDSFGGTPYQPGSDTTHFVMDDMVVSIAPVPEPSTILLLGSSLIGLSGLVFYRKYPRKSVYRDQSS